VRRAFAKSTKTRQLAALVRRSGTICSCVACPSAFLLAANVSKQDAVFADCVIHQMMQMRGAWGTTNQPTPSRCNTQTLTIMGDEQQNGLRL
jgi:hypothetical protein